MNPKKTLLPEPTGLTESNASYSVATLTATFAGVNEVPPDKRNCVWSEKHVKEILNPLKEAKLYWLEEPLWPPENYTGLSKLRNKGITIASGENACTSYQFEEMISNNAADILQPSVTKVGGISEIIKISKLKKNNNRVVPHSPYFGPGFIATLQVIGALIPDSEICYKN